MFKATGDAYYRLHWQRAMCRSKRWQRLYIEAIYFLALVMDEWSRRFGCKRSVYSSKSSSGPSLEKNDQSQYSPAVHGGRNVSHVERRRLASSTHRMKTQPKDSAPRSEDVRSSLDRRPASAAITLRHVVRGAKNISAGGKASQWP